MSQDELARVGIKGISLKVAALIQHKCYFLVSSMATVMYFLYVLCYLVYDNAPSLAYLVGEDIPKDYYEMIIPGWRIVQYIQLVFIAVFIVEIALHMIAFKKLHMI